MALPASDPLTNPSLVTLPAYSANWTQLVNTYSVNAGGCFQSVGGNGAAVWNADTFPKDQFCQLVLSGSGATGVFIGPACRQSSLGTLTEYALRVNVNGSQWQVVKFVSNVFTNLSGTTSGAFASGDTLRIQAVGTNISAYQNGNLLYSTTDSSIDGSSSACGIAGSGGNSVAEVKTWTAGAASTAVPVCIYVLP